MLYHGQINLDIQQYSMYYFKYQLIILIMFLLVLPDLWLKMQETGRCSCWRATVPKFSSGQFRLRPVNIKENHAQRPENQLSELLTILDMKFGLPRACWNPCRLMERELQKNHPFLFLIEVDFPSFHHCEQRHLPITMIVQNKCHIVSYCRAEVYMVSDMFIWEEF